MNPMNPRKRRRVDSTPRLTSPKRCKIKHPQHPTVAVSPINARNSVLSHCYPRLLPLREFLTSRLPASSRVRRKKLNEHETAPADGKVSFLDTTLVGVLDEPDAATDKARTREFDAFTQTQRDVPTCSGLTPSEAHVKQNLEYCIWLLFHRSYSSAHRPRHILCNGFQKGLMPQAACGPTEPVLAIPGIVQVASDDHLQTLLSTPWTSVFALLRGSLDNILRHLLLDCGLFTVMPGGKDNYYQISGTPVSELCLPGPKLLAGLGNHAACSHQTKRSGNGRKPNEISFVRYRMLYARPSLNSNGQVRFGMKHIHVFNRFPDASALGHTQQILQYMFPRQFGLHNVFTTQVDRRETSQPFQDYTMRDAEINQAASVKKFRLPRRLRHRVLSLVREIQKKHAQCTYSQLLRHYCPLRTACSPRSLGAMPIATQSQHSDPLIAGEEPISLHGNSAQQVSDNVALENAGAIATGFATPYSHVSAFCNAVLRRILPRSVLGDGCDGINNWKVFLQAVDLFIRLRRLETLTLHQVMAGIKVTCIAWLKPENNSHTAKLAKSDFEKRSELLQEWIYYCFDSLLIPLIRSHFYVTESATHNKSLFYFRHDVWRKIAAPALATLQTRMLDPLPQAQSRTLLKAHRLGYSQLRLVPKARGMRPIVNLRRRTMVVANGKKVLAQSVNKRLHGILNVLKYEKDHQMARLGSALFSVSDIHRKLTEFKTILGNEAKPLYFVKVDVKSCFDTIPQTELMDLIARLLSQSEYRVTKHAEVRWAKAMGQNQSTTRCKFAEQVMPSDGTSPTIQGMASTTKRGAVHAVTGIQGLIKTSNVLRMLHEHVQNNMIKAGKRYYRQKTGISQGSVLSSLLCSFFYGDFERNELPFLRPETSLLLRLIDDFLLITVEKSIAIRFSQTMAAGAPAYGIYINPPKSLANFELDITGVKVPRHHGTFWFPYCGMAINTQNLQVSRDWERRDNIISHTLTVERSRKPGQTLQQRLLLFVKVRMDSLLSDTRHNSLGQVCRNIYDAFAESALKIHQYYKHLHSRRPGVQLIVEAVNGLVHLTWNLVHQTSRAKAAAYECNISRSHINWLAAAAFEHVLRKKQTLYRDVLPWLAALRTDHEGAMKPVGLNISTVATHGATVFGEYVF